jgi:hypothetical protein
MSVKALFTNKQMVSILNLDADYPETDRLERLSLSASQYLLEHTGYDWSQDATINPLAYDCGEMFVKQRWYEGSQYAKEYDFTMGIQDDLFQLSLKAKSEGLV